MAIDSKPLAACAWLRAPRIRPRPTAIALAILLIVPVAAMAPARPVAAADPSPSPSAATSIWYELDADGEPRIQLYYGYSTTCPHCAAARPWLEDYAARTPWLDVHWLRVDGDDAEAAANVAFLVDLAEGVGEQIEAVPAFFFGQRLRIGFEEVATTGADLEAEIDAYRTELLTELANPSPTPSPTTAPGASPTPDTGLAVTIPFIGSVDARSLSLPLLAVVLGALDSVNPCALAVLLFLMTVMASVRSRPRMAIVGGTFVMVSGLVYFALMAAWLNVFLMAGELRIVTLIAGVLATIAALINIKDFAWFRQGPSLVMPEAAKPAVFGRILDIGDATRLSAMVAATVLVAATANAYEMLCTGGFPVVFARILTLNELPTPVYYGYLALYNVAYVLLPALIVIGLVITLGSRGVSERTARRLKLLSGLLMLGLGLELIFAPQLLADLGATALLVGGAVGLWLLALLAERAGVRGPLSPMA